MMTRKVCLLGAFAVGKTSLVRRFVHGVFDERYLTTLGVKIDTKTVQLKGDTVKLVVWDIEGADPDDDGSSPVRSRMQTYLQGADGVLLVVDGTRAATVETARIIVGDFSKQHPGVPLILMLNKSDRADEWQVDPQQLEGFPGLSRSFSTSALSGQNVEAAFTFLAELLAETEGSSQG
ncbi:MAG: GTP-binding protein [Xanthomonadales bacterium]|nr:GTP-binding protein [Xanthomonadales bacterium]